MNDPSGDELQDATDSPPEKPGWGFYAALALVGLLVLMVVFLNYPAQKASAGAIMSRTCWTMQSYTDRTGILVPALTSPAVTAGFGSDGTLTGSGGCNRYTAHYTTKDYTMTISDTASTMMSCAAPGVMDQESAYLADLPRAASFRVDDSSLRIYDAGGRPVIIFVPA